MSFRKSFKNRVSVVSNTDDDIETPAQYFRDLSEEEERALRRLTRLSQYRKSSRRPSARLTILSDMLENYSGRRSVQIPIPNVMDEVNRLQWLLSSNLPGISGITLPENWEELVKPRKTIAELQADLEEANDDINMKRQWRKDTRIDDYIRNMALKKLEADTFKQLRIIYNNHVAQMNDYNDQMPSFSPFGWTVEDFVKRRNERNTVWLDVLLSLSEKDLEMLKFKCDLEELFKLLRLLFEGLKDVSNETKENLFEFIHNAYEYLKFPQVLKVEAKKNMERLGEQVNTYLDMMNFKLGAEEEAYKLAMEQKLVDLSVTGPIELRYEVNWMFTKTDQAIMKITNALEAIENKANDYRKEEAKESYCARNVLDMYYVDIDKYKRQIAELSQQYDTELEKAENEISYKKLSMDKLREQRKFYEEQIIRFADEIEELHRKELEEKMAEEERLREEEMRALEEAAALAKKAKGKGKGNKGKKK